MAKSILEWAAPKTKAGAIDTDRAATGDDLRESCDLHTILDCPGGTFQGAGVKTVVLFFKKGNKTRKTWYYQLDPGRNMGKTNPLIDAFVKEIRELIVSGRTTVARGVDLVQVHTNFEIGRRIVEQEQKGKGRAAYGEEVIKALADRLTSEFGNVFSARNLAYFRTFYSTYAKRNPILQTPSAKSKNLEIPFTLS